MNMTGTLLTAAGAFAATNLDDLVVLAILFLSNRSLEIPNTWKIWTGQYLGLGGIVALSILATLGLTTIPLAWIGMLGVVPLALGIRGLIRIARPAAEKVAVEATSLGSIAAMILANGGDNVSVYVPLFRAMDVWSELLTMMVFVVLIGVWCTAASWLTRHPKIIGALRRWGHWAVPMVYVTIGVMILVRSGAFVLLPAAGAVGFG